MVDRAIGGSDAGARQEVKATAGAFDSKDSVNSIKKMEGGGSDGKAAAPTVGNRDTAALIFDVNCPLTPYLPDVNNPKVTGSVKETGKAFVPTKDYKNWATLDLNNPNLNSYTAPPERKLTPRDYIPFVTKKVELNMHDGSWGSLFGGSAPFYDSKKTVETRTPENGIKQSPAQARFTFETPEHIKMGTPGKGLFDFPASKMTITDTSRYPTIMSRDQLPGIDATYKVSIEDAGNREVRFGVAKDGTVTTFSQNTANDKLFPESADGKFLDTLPHLQSVSLMDADKSRFEHVKNLKELRELSVHLKSDVTSGAPLTNADKLERLRLAIAPGIDDLGFLQNKPNMRSLYLGNMKVDGEDFKNLQGMKNLQSLELWNINMNDRGLEHISGLSDLQKLSLGSAPITDTGMASIAKFEHLNELYVGSSGVTDSGVAKISGLKQLTNLTLNSTSITDEGLKTIGQMQQLTKLNLFATNVTDAGIANLKELKNLKELEVGLVPLTDKGLAEIAKLPKLETLYLDPAKMTNEGLQQLAQAKNLKEIIYVSNGFPNKNCNAEGLKALKAKRPDLRIVGAI